MKGGCFTRSGGGKAMLRGVFAVAAVLVLTWTYGCSRAYELNIEFASGKTPSTGAPVYLDGQKIGHVAAVEEQSGGGFQVRAVLDDRDAVQQSVKRGIMPYLDNGAVRIDASQVAHEAETLPSGSTITGYGLPTVLLKKYARVQTVIAVNIGSLALLMLTWVFRHVFRFVVVLLSLLLSLGIAAMVYVPLTPLVDRGLGAIAGSSAQHAPVTAPAPAGEGQSAAKAAVLPGTEQAAGVREIVQKIARPNPAVVSFMTVWLASFVALQLCFGAALKATRKTG